MNVGERIVLFSGILAFFGCGSPEANERQQSVSLKEAFEDKFYIGTALNINQIQGIDQEGDALVEKQFNAITAENCMKAYTLQPKEEQFDFTIADQFVEFGRQHNMHIVGHTLIWHSQAPEWFFVGEGGNEVSKEVLIERMRKHITAVVSRYKGRVHGWDVVNEAIEDDGSWRENKFYTIIGEDYVRLAFEFARQADPEAALYYNDYSMSNKLKREGVVRMVKALQQQQVKVSGIGMQGHVGLDYPELDEFEASLIAFSLLGVQVLITELDMTVLPSPFKMAGAEVSTNFEYKESMDPYKKGLSEAKQIEQTKRYADFFRLFLKHQDKISRVTLWGVTDGDSWKNDWPIMGRTDYTLLFDRQHQPKPAVAEIIALLEEKSKHSRK